MGRDANLNKGRWPHDEDGGPFFAFAMFVDAALYKRFIANERIQVRGADGVDSLTIVPNRPLGPDDFAEAHLAIGFLAGSNPGPHRLRLESRNEQGVYGRVSNIEFTVGDEQWTSIVPVLFRADQPTHAWVRILLNGRYLSRTSIRLLKES